MTSLLHRPTTVFQRPEDRFAAEPAEHRGLRRDEIRLLVADGPSDILTDTRFDRLPEYLRPGDLLVVNNSQTFPGELDARAEGNWPVVLHLAGRLEDGCWVLELRSSPDAARSILTATAGQSFIVTADQSVSITLVEPYAVEGRRSPTGSGTRLWRARVRSDRPLQSVLNQHGRPIAYGYLSQSWPLVDYQTVFGTRPGSAEMPSAGRPFSAELVTRLVADGVLIAPITLHTGVSSQEAGEGPQPEWFEVPNTTARLVNDVRCAGGRVVAVGTTVTRALESAVDDDGFVLESRGWTSHIVGPDSPARVVSGLVTGLHDPNASHLLLVESVAGAELTQRVYDAAVAGDYLWHEFGDSCLLLP